MVVPSEREEKKIEGRGKREGGSGASVGKGGGERWPTEYTEDTERGRVGDGRKKARKAQKEEVDVAREIRGRARRMEILFAWFSGVRGRWNLTTGGTEEEGVTGGEGGKGLN